MARHDLEAIVEKQIPALRRYAFALVRDHHASDDLVQDCLERALSAWSRKRADDPRAWLFTILRNTYLSTYRTQKRRGVPASMETIGEPALPPDQESGLQARDALAALDRLPEDQRSILLLIGVEDLTYDEAARVLGIPLGTVMSRLSRARHQLRVNMERGRSPLLRRVK